jgi:hypothetical protein
VNGSSVPTRPEPTSHPSGPAGPALGTTGDSLTPPPPEEGDQRQNRRRKSYRRKLVQRSGAASKSSRQCMFAAGMFVRYSFGRQAIAHTSGVARCASPWSCPVCAPVIGERRATEITGALDRHLANGGDAVMVTLTLRHHLGSALAPMVAIICTALGLVFRGSGWTRRRDRLGFIGSIRSVEVTYGANGWHPHLHALLLFDHVLTVAELDDLRSWVHGRWAGQVAKAGLGTISATYGVDLEPVRSIEALGPYLTKTDGKGEARWGVGREMARGDVKSAAGLVPFELLDLAATGDGRALALFREYEEATAGRLKLRWSDGLKALLLVDDVTDDDAAASEGVEAEYYWRVQALGRLHNRLLTTGMLADLLTEWEGVIRSRIAAADLAGRPLRPLAPDEVTDDLADEDVTRARYRPAS